MSTNEQENLLEQIPFPADLRKLPIEKLEQVCRELRQYIITVLSENPGHLGASLGTVELTVALHYVFNTPTDRIVWDVGHQAYGHKILTGRRESFHTLRQFKGISGFPNPEESEYDAFIAGHASNSISAALGMSVGCELNQEGYRNVVAVIGDGAMTGGLAFEGLNNVSTNPNNLLIILNDNDMAIDNSVGGLSRYLVNITTSQTYNKIRYKVYKLLRKINLLSEKRRENILRFNNSLKALINRQHNLFEGFSIRYFGPVDGHDVTDLVQKLNDIKEMKGPKLLHIKTKKGKGFKPAEDSATEWHAPGKFNKETGERVFLPQNLDEPQLYQDVFGHTLVELAEKDKRVVGVTPAMPTGCSMNYLIKAFPDRAFDVGIAEGHAMTFSAGLAKEGLIPFCNIYSSFMQRAYDQVIHDVAIQNLPLVLCLDRAGLVGEDGVTHQGVFDLACLRPIPNLTIASPLNEWDLRNLMFTGYHASNPFIIRYPRGKGELKHWQNKMEILPVGKGKKLNEGSQIAILSIGTIGNAVVKAIEMVEKENISVAHYDMIYLKPMDDKILHEAGKQFTHIITVEDGTITGGLGSAVIEFMAENGYPVHIKRIGVDDRFIEHGSIPELYQLCGMDAASIAQMIRTLVKENG